MSPTCKIPTTFVLPGVQGSTRCLRWWVNSGMEFPSACISLDETYFLGCDKPRSEDVWIVMIELKCVQHQAGEKQLTRKASTIWHLELPEVLSGCTTLPASDCSRPTNPYIHFREERGSNSLIAMADSIRQNWTAPEFNSHTRQQTETNTSSSSKSTAWGTFLPWRMRTEVLSEQKNSPWSSAQPINSQTVLC